MLNGLYLDHLVLRARDLTVVREFYRTLFGEPLYQNEDSLMYLVGETRLFFATTAQEVGARYDKEQPGLNHLAFGVREPAALRDIRAQLDEARVVNSGIRIDHYGGQEFIWPDDPNGFRLEFYCRPTTAI